MCGCIRALLRVRYMQWPPWVGRSPLCARALTRQTDNHNLVTNVSVGASQMLVLSLCLGAPARHVPVFPRHVPVMRRAPAARMCTTGAAHARIVVAQRNLPPSAAEKALISLATVDAGFATSVVAAASAEHTRIVLSPVGSCDNDMDDVRKVGEAAASGAAKAFAMGATDLTLEVEEAIEQISHPVDGPGAFEYVTVHRSRGLCIALSLCCLTRRGTSLPLLTSQVRSLVNTDTPRSSPNSECCRAHTCRCKHARPPPRS